MYKVGITGGIGTGKSTVCRIFSLLGIPVYDADTRAKWLTENDPGIRAALIKSFGEEVFATGVLNRAFLASVAFKDASSTALLNSITHPPVGEDFKQWVQAQAHAPYVLKEAALLYEAGTDKELDAMIVVTAPVELRMRRVLTRDPQRTEAQVSDIMSRQWSDEEKIARADFTISNDEQQLLIPQVLHLHEQFIRNALS
ncbi:dephospho-CoA kinase [Cytophaga hutchinsonii]|jgi:dephospho-CoA kinase|uniref:Dephospho-CoA kinase n=1 Tax=Cytophaga hutchinsonii (strain ATCC 33406 / DSM 1761 / CIP 103989 / NBRC 15051 / NCIMB 9469 / D465) TaxID=269798 RepID=A0A6N4STQ3_CYTH3|nr:dephospho-CoA kinase [Cytophaga hutchinsonii]ABG59696.1 dephospho-CoA kinase [Cytophaga hutchinsonii ATCC 33406]SFX65770.1 dephospho-CoA kinase [Cytophaga hutchinsonii ATCC 33406]